MLSRAPAREARSWCAISHARFCPTASFLAQHMQQQRLRVTPRALGMRAGGNELSAPQHQTSESSSDERVFERSECVGCIDSA